MKIRTTKPKNNDYYIRQASGGLNGAVAGQVGSTGKPDPTANVLANCVGFANGRYNEIINDPDLKGIKKPFKYQLVCNAENFIERAKALGLKVQKRPCKGGIMVWQKGRTLSGNDGAGHVAICEKDESEMGVGRVYTSESGWNGSAFWNATRSNDNGRWGMAAAYTYRGCIVNPTVPVKQLPKETDALAIDGKIGPKTVKKLQKWLGTTQNGKIAGQTKSVKEHIPAMADVCTWTGKGSTAIKALQKTLKKEGYDPGTIDGLCGEKTVKALQEFLKAKKFYTGAIDGILGAGTAKALQKFLNTK